MTGAIDQDVTSSAICCSRRARRVSASSIAWLVLTRSLGRFGISDGAMTLQRGCVKSVGKNIRSARRFPVGSTRDTSGVSGTMVILGGTTRSDRSRILPNIRAIRCDSATELRTHLVGRKRAKYP